MCKITDCSNKPHTKGMCVTHYNAERIAKMNLPCSVEGCENLQIAMDMCSNHYQRKRWHNQKYKVPCDQKGCETPRYGAGDFCFLHKPIKYIAAHARVRKARGNAREYDCEWCHGDATEWCYDHEDPEELIHQGNDTHYGMPYSRKVEHYKALCTYCHRLLDGGKVWGSHERD